MERTIEVYMKIKAKITGESEAEMDDEQECLMIDITDYLLEVSDEHYEVIKAVETEEPVVVK